MMPFRNHSVTDRLPPEKQSHEELTTQWISHLSKLGTRYARQRWSQRNRASDL